MSKYLLLIIFSISIPALAQNNKETSETLYAELGYAYVPFRDTGYDLGSFGVGLARFGVGVHKNIAIEGMAGTGISDASFYYGRTLINTKVNSLYGVYLKPKFQVADSAELFARVGYAHVNVTASYGYGTYTAWGGSLSYGLGAQVSFTKTVYGALDWMSYYDKSGTTGKGPSVSVGVKF